MPLARSQRSSMRKSTRGKWAGALCRHTKKCKSPDAHGPRSWVTLLKPWGHATPVVSCAAWFLAFDECHATGEKETADVNRRFSSKSGWADSNRRPSDPPSDALTKLRYTPSKTAQRP